MVYDEQLHSTAQDIKYYNLHFIKTTKEAWKDVTNGQSQKKHPSMKTKVPQQEKLPVDALQKTTDFISRAALQV